MANSNLSFKRKERKYIILENTFEEVKNELQKRIPIFIFTGNDPISQMETIYLDTKDLTLFKEYLNRRFFRFKIRLRRYGYNNIFENQYLVELKAKCDGISRKKRFILPAEYLSAFLKGENIKPVIKEINKGMSGAQKTYKLIAKLIELNQLVPVLKTSYERIAFQKKSKKNRVTIDQNIMHTKLMGKSKEVCLDASILESKVAGKTPKWHKKMVNKLSLLRQQRFSKFATGINSLYYPSRGIYNFSDDEFVVEDMPETISQSFDLMKKYLKLAPQE